MTRLPETTAKTAKLQGDYLIVHDKDKMANEEQCLFVYKAGTGTAKEPIVSVHAKLVQRPATAQSRIRAPRVSEGVGGVVRWLREIQFAGSTSAHQFP